MAEQKLTSIEIGRAALRIAVTENRAEEQRIKEQLAAKGIRSGRFWRRVYAERC